jgi:hypothetical protein
LSKQKIPLREFFVLAYNYTSVAGVRLERTPLGYEPNELPLLNPAIFIGLCEYIIKSYKMQIIPLDLVFQVTLPRYPLTRQ